MKRYGPFVVIAAILHGCTAICLAALSLRRAEQEFQQGRLPWHTLFVVLGKLAQLLLFPLLLIPSNVTEPRTTILFVANSFAWGIAIVCIYAVVTHYRDVRSSPGDAGR
jgi:hypothetical protein